LKALLGPGHWLAADVAGLVIHSRDDAVALSASGHSPIKVPARRGVYESSVLFWVGTFVS
jgi:hypothetical protein